MKTFKSILEVQKANEKLGQTWFGKKEMEFFSTYIESELLFGRYFITSDKAPHNPRGYTIRKANDNGSIETIGEFCGYSTKQAAENALAKIVLTQEKSKEE